MRTSDRALLTLLVLAVARAASGQTVVNVDASADQHPIDPAVYGVAYATPAQLQDLRVTAHRRGGNNTSRYNWQQNADNRGNDWFYQSIAYASPTAGADVDDFIEDTFAGNAEPMITIPMVGWVAKLGPNRTKLASFSAQKYGAQQSCDWQWYPDACNGVLLNGQFVQNNDRNDANVPANGAFHEGWFDHLVNALGHRGQRRTALLHPRQRVLHLARDPSRRAPGGREHGRDPLPGDRLRDPHQEQRRRRAGDGAGGVGLARLPAERLRPAVGRRARPVEQHARPRGARRLGLRALAARPDAARGREAGRRLLDVFSLHYYPQGGEFGDDVSTAMQQRRNRSTRSLWDPNYVDETWINDRVRLIPRMRQWVAQYYPNTRTAITEYNWGAEGHINGATTQADIFGIFGREGLDIGARWTTPGHLHADVQVHQDVPQLRRRGRRLRRRQRARATAPDPDNVSAFAARRSVDGALTVMLVAKRLSGATAPP